jgi:hypothetical protein
VVEGPTVSLASFANVCNNVQPFNLTGGSPAGGCYSGPGVSNGIFTPSLLGAGTYEITYTFTDANGCEGSATQAIKVDDCTSGLADLNNGLQFEMFPNPTSDKVNLMINNDETTDINIRIISLDGKIIESVFIRNTLNFNHTLDVYNYTSGVYFVHISSNLGNVVKKLIVN